MLVFLNRLLLFFFSFIVFKTSAVAYKGCWLSNVVPYQIEEGFMASNNGEWQRQQILNTIGVLHRETCVRWIDMSEHNFSGADHAAFVHTGNTGISDTCFMQGQFKDGRFKANIFLADVCFDIGAAMHEMLHVLGFGHEHQRADRDCYIIVDQEIVEETNLQASYKIKYQGEWLERFPYDKKSVMHYDRDVRIKAKSERWYDFEPLGNLEGKLTEIDLWKIRYRLCNGPHYCDVFPSICETIDKWEEEQGCRKSP